MLYRFLISVLVVMALTLPAANPARAQVVGTHLGEGDIGWQVSIMERVVKGNGAADGTPVTIQVSTNTSSDNIAKLAEAAQGLLPIWRIDPAGKCREVVDGSRVVADIRSHLGDSAVIVFGNEVNNQTVECTNYTNFIASYNNHLAGLGIGVSALDFYNTNDPAQGFLDAGGRALYAGNPYFFANAYGCVGTNSAGCQLDTTTQVDGYRFAADLGSFYLTEFSLSPEGNSSDAPDTDLRKVVDFIDSRASDTGAIAITPLIRNACTNQAVDGEWLIFLSKTATGRAESEVFTRSGLKINIDSCSASDPSDYFLYPIPGAIEQDRDLFYQSLERQGYEARCTSPVIMVNSFVSSISEQLYSQVDVNNAYVSNEFDKIIDLGSARVPLWRQDGFMSLSIINSIETLFGYRGATQLAGESIHPSLSDAPIYRRTTPKQQCQLQLDMLQTVEKMCDKLADPSNCALDIAIENSPFTARSLLREVRDSIGGDLSGETCSQIIRELDRGDPLRVGLNYTPLFLPNAYRLGFLVLSAELKGDGSQWGTGSPFKFLRGTDELNTHLPKNEVRVFAFKIPDVATNKDPDSDIFYRDALEQTSYSTLTVDQIRQVEEGYRELLEFEDYQMRINCDNPPNSKYCGESALVQAIVDFVNRKLQDPHEHCDLLPKDLPYETVQELFSSAGLPESEGRVHNNPPEGDIVTRLKEQWIGQNAPLSDDPNEGGSLPWPFRFLSIGDAKTEGGGAPVHDGWENMMKIRSYMILPLGYKLHHIENALMGQFFTTSQIEVMNQAFADTNNTNFVEFLKLSDTGQAIRGNPGQTVSASGVFPVNFDYDTIPPNCRNISGNETGPGWIACQETIRNTIEADMSDIEPRIPGGRLATIVRQMQLSINQLFDPFWDHIEQCETLENMILGRCGTSGQVPYGEQDERFERELGDACGAGQKTAEEINPGYWRQSPLDRSRPVDIPDNPYRGQAMYYARGLMNQVLANRKAWGDIDLSRIVSCDIADLDNNPNPGGHIGCVALYRAGDIGREIWLEPTRVGGGVVGPFLVIDVAARKDIPCLIERDWVVDIDYQTAARWGMVGVGPTEVIIHTSGPGRGGASTTTQQETSPLQRMIDITF